MSRTGDYAPRRPAAFRVDDPAVETAELELDGLEPDEADAHAAVETIAAAPKRRFRFARLARWTGAALVSLIFYVAADSLVRDLFARADWLGWVGLGLLALFVLAIAGMIAREVAALLRLKQVARLRLRSDEAALANDRDASVAVVKELLSLYATRPDTARGRRSVGSHIGEIMDGRDLLKLAERDLLLALDAEARAATSAAARRVSVVTAVSPRAFVDILYVLWEAIRLIRRISTLYGGRPGTIGLMRLVRAVLGHLAVTGTIAIGDTIVQQVVGHGVAARLSARFGEGIVNGFMTARIGLSAIDVCRPLPFIAGERPRLKDLTADLASVTRKEQDRG